MGNQPMSKELGHNNQVLFTVTPMTTTRTVVNSHSKNMQMRTRSHGRVSTAGAMLQPKPRTSSAQMCLPGQNRTNLKVPSTSMSMSSSNFKANRFMF